MQPKYYHISVSIILQEARTKPNGLFTRHLKKKNQLELVKCSELSSHF